MDENYLNTEKTYCPKCGHKFNQGEYEYDYDSGMLNYDCPDCDWSGNENAVINDTKVENDLYDKLDEYDLEGIEITDEDVLNVFKEIEDGEEYEDALKHVLQAISDCLE